MEDSGVDCADDLRGQVHQHFAGGTQIPPPDPSRIRMNTSPGKHHPADGTVSPIIRALASSAVGNAKAPTLATTPSSRGQVHQHFFRGRGTHQPPPKPSGTNVSPGGQISGSGFVRALASSTPATVKAPTLAATASVAIMYLIFTFELLCLLWSPRIPPSVDYR